MNKEVSPYNIPGRSKKKEVAEMFDHISPRYDLLNRLLSLGIDKVWRKKVIKLIRSENPTTILDVATGTADLAIGASAINPEKIIGIDISSGMIEYGNRKVHAKGLSGMIELVEADSENIPFEDNKFDVATVAFGVRNFEDLDKGMIEIHRVLRIGGRLIILEFSKPKNRVISKIYWLYFSRILPWVGRILSGDRSAYSYLPQSVANFPDGKEFTEIMERCGFSDCTQKELTFGVASVYSGFKK